MSVASHLKNKKKKKKAPFLGLKVEAAGSASSEINLACHLLGLQRD